MRSIFLSAGIILATIFLAGATAPASTKDPNVTKPGRCLLEVDGVKYISGRCNITFIEKGTGSFEIEEIRKGGFYFAQVLIDSDGARGYWNGERAATHAHNSLGVLERDGACWTNDRARICAWR